MFKLFRRKKEEIETEDIIRLGPYVPPPPKEGMVQTAKVPEPMRPLFYKAENTVAEFFEKMAWDPTKGYITIAGERYILMRASSLRVHFQENLTKILDIPEGQAEATTSRLLYNLAKVMGGADARRFHYTMNLIDPIAKLSAGPIHFAFSGWAFVDISDISKPSPDENYFLQYDHPQSFEADSWIVLKGKTAKRPVCVMNAGYSAGWCEESFGIELEGRELMCRAKGDRHCRFIMTHPSKIDEKIKEFWEREE
ncbi:MAG: V4R domain-containing protein [Candidatus Hodarchaeota archaeon]